MIKNNVCKMCGIQLKKNAWFCQSCKKIRNRECVDAYSARKKNLKKQKGEKNLLRLKEMLEGVDLTPYLPKPGQELEEAQHE